MKKIVALIISIFCAIGLFGCSSIDYNAVIIKEGITYHQEWLDNNQVYDSFNFETHEWDNSSPKDRTYVITVQEDLDNVFKEFPSVDFENKMVILYCYRTIYCREQKLNKVVLEDNNLEIEFNIVSGKFGHADAAMPQTRVCVIVLDKVDTSNVKVTYKGQ